MLQSQLAKGPQFMTKWASVSWECKPHLLPIRTVITETNKQNNNNKKHTKYW